MSLQERYLRLVYDKVPMDEENERKVSNVIVFLTQTVIKKQKNNNVYFMDEVGFGEEEYAIRIENKDGKDMLSFLSEFYEGMQEET